MMRMELDGCDIMPINKVNYTDVWGVYESNREYLQSWELGKVVEVDDILETFTRLPDGYDASKQVFVGIWRNGEPVAICDLLPQLDGDDNLWLSEIIVHQDEKGKGFGKSIVQAIVAAAQQADFARITLGCSKSKALFLAKNGL
ncbi:MAG: GNAT family N-acetyltransferase [Defluviitaleaceae bacterium]|nr:GNAT family N-acetyltransferase [Defluviitaleaceae bacterium]